MNADVSIRVENLGKLYRIGERVPYKTLRDSLARSSRRVLSKGRQRSGNSEEDAQYIWALKDLSFEVKRGQVVGIIGRNGAGKSTVLKILSRIVDPTEGYAEIDGRVGSLLEVGTGFHPELTGRENVYLSGAVLGMKKLEIDRKFNEIVAFAELERFIGTPLKYYSSGMQVRLGFAVAAYLEPEILLVDEVLAVGDAAFQKKCIGKMGEVTKQGRTVLFVSHQMNSIRSLCDRCIWLDMGRIRMVDSTVKVVSAYESSFTSPHFADVRRTQDASVPARFLSWEVVEPKAEQPNMITTLGPVRFKVVLLLNRPVRNGVHGIALWNKDNQLMWGWAAYGLDLGSGVHEFLYALPSLPLRPGVYRWQVSLYSDGSLLDNWQCVPELIVATNPLTHPRDEWSGILNIPCNFDLRGVPGS